MRILSASSDKSMMIWQPDPDTGVWINEVRVGEIGGNTLGFYGGLFSRDGKHIIAHGSNGSFHLWHNISTDEGNRELVCTSIFRPLILISLLQILTTGFPRYPSVGILELWKIWYGIHKTCL